MTEQETADVVVHTLANEKLCSECRQWRPREHFQIMFYRLKRADQWQTYAGGELGACQACRREDLDRRTRKFRHLFR